MFVTAALLACAVPNEGDATRVSRLTATQWENATQQMLGMRAPSGYSEFFVKDPAAAGFDNDADVLSVDPTLWQQYQAAGESLAFDTVASHDRFERAMGVRPEHFFPADRYDFIDRIGRRAFRRSLTHDERVAYGDLFEMAARVYPRRTPQMAGVQVTLGAMLQSPHFLYKIERVGPDGTEIAPTDYATKLSFALWNNAPDDRLIGLAESVWSNDELAAEVPRMLADERARDMIRDLHRQLLHVDDYANIPRLFISYEDYTLSENGVMEAEVEQFVDHIVFGGGTVADLYTSRQTFVDAQIADVYGVEGVDGIGIAEMKAVDLPADERAGLLTLSGFLALHASPTEENLIRRSAFVHEVLMCTHLPAPPPDASPLPVVQGLSQRERIEEHTRDCGGACHNELINPIAYSFGRYTNRGRFRPRSDVDTSSEFSFSSGRESFEDAVELSEILATDPQTHECYVSNLFSYLHGRGIRPEDSDQLEQLTQASLQGEPILTLIADVVRHPSFRTLEPLEGSHP